MKQNEKPDEIEKYSSAGSRATLIEYLNQHGRPQSRREFIARGLWVGGGAVSVSNRTLLFGLGGMGLDPRSVDSTRGHPEVACIVFDLAGGAALPGNFLVGGRGGAEDLLPSYASLGWDPRAAGAQLDRTYGLPMAAGGISRILSGLTSSASPEARARFRMSSMLHVAQDDSRTNPLSILSLVSRTRGSDRRIPVPVGVTRGESGGNSRSAIELSEQSAYLVNTLEDLIRFAALAEPLLPIRDRGASAELLQMASGLASIQLKRFFAPMDVTRMLGEYARVGDRVATEVGLDPRQDPVFREVYGINGGTSSRSESALRAGLVLAALKGFATGAVVTVPGCDYHNGTQTLGDTKDQEIGIEIGRAVEAAHRLRVPLFIQVITDGGVFADPGTRVWRGDDGQKSMSVIGYYDPAGPAVQIRTQVGAYASGQGADRKTLIGSSPQLAALACFANYLNLCGRIGEFDSIVGRGVFTPSEIDSILVFEK